MRICCMTQGPQTWTLQNAEGWGGEEDGRKIQREGTWVYLWLILADVWQKTTKFCKAITFQLKKKITETFLFWTDVQWIPFRLRTTRLDTELTNMGSCHKTSDLHLFTDLKLFNTTTKRTITSDGEDVEKLDFSYIAGENVKWYNHKVIT